MIYTDIDKLTVIQGNITTDRVSFDVIARILLEKPANMIYCISKGGGSYTGLLAWAIL